MFKKLLIVTIVLFFFINTDTASAVTLESTKSASLNVSARVNPRPADFQFNFTSDLAQSAATADREITYTLTYGSKIDYGTPMVITASWSLGTVREQNLYTYEILSYVAGSASKDYWGESTPIVDIKNRKITWTITRFPPNTIDKTLTFKLKTPGRYVTDKQVNFTVTSTMKTEQIEVGSITLDQIYNPTEFIRSEVKGLKILSLDVRRITDHSFTIYIVTTEPSTVIVYYGTDPDNLDQTITDDTLSDQKAILIDNLDPVTTYYFRVLIENAKGIQRKTPETFMVTTAATSLLSQIDQDRVMITSRGVSLKSRQGIGPASAVLIPVNQPLDVYLPFITQPPAGLLASVESRDVLGVSDPQPLPNIAKIRLLETQSGVYTGQINSPLTRGQYDLVLETEDPTYPGSEDVLTVLEVTNPITVLDVNQKPIEKALVYLEWFNPNRGAFDFFPGSSFGAKNPAYTNGLGQADIVLPYGEYSLNVNAPGYKTHQSKFTVSGALRQGYPIVSLDSAGFSPLSYIDYYWQTLRDSIVYLNYTIKELSQSYRFMDLTLLTGLTLLTFLSLLLNLYRVKMSLEGFFINLEKKFRWFWNREPVKTLFIGFVEDSDSHLPVFHATVLLLKKSNRVIVGKDITNVLGEFQLQIKPTDEYELAIKKPGYSLIKTSINAADLLDQHPPFILEKDRPTHLPEWLQFIIVMFQTIIHGISDTLHLSVILLHILLIGHIGIIRQLPLVLVTTVNFILWLEHHYMSFKAKQKS